jgi:type I restriction enzyme, S subunit
MKQDNEHIPEGYRDSPLGVIPEGWKVKRLGEVGSQLPTFSFSRDQMTTEPQQLRYVHYGDIHINAERDKVFLDKDILPFLRNGIISDEKQEKEDFPYLKNGDLLITDASEDYNGVGKALEIINTDNKKIIAGLHTIALRLNSKYVQIGFGRFLFKNKYDSNLLRKIAQGTKVYSISYNSIAKLSILLPTLPEQKKIAEILSTWDDAIEQQSKLIDALTRRKHGLMQQLLSGKKRFTGFTNKWDVKRFHELFIERNETHREDLPLLSITANRGVILQSESDKRDISNDDKSKYKRICSNDIGYNTMRMWQGRSALSSMEGIVSPAYTIVTPKKNVHPLYMAMLCKQPRVVYDFWTHSQGLVSDTLNCKFLDFGLVKAYVPTFAEQTVIAERLTAADIEIELAKQKLSHLRNQKRGLMQQLLTGQIRITI